MKNTATIINFSTSYLLDLYLEYGLNAVQKVIEDVTIQYVKAEECAQKARHLDSRYIVIFLSYDNYSVFQEFCSNLGSEHIVVACHYIATFFGRELLSEVPNLDYVVVGEYDTTLTELLKCLVMGVSPIMCKGIWMRYTDEMIFTGKRPQISDLDQLDFVRRESLPREKDIFHVFASRGCEGHCTFCDRNALYLGENQNHRFRSISNIMSEIDLLVEKYNCRFITFSDSTFCSNDNIVERLRELYFELKKRPYWIQFFVNLRAEQINEKVMSCLQQLKQVGLGKVFIGIESFVQKDLDVYGKISNASTNMKALKLIASMQNEVDDYNLSFEYGFIMFNPYTTLDDLVNNLKELVSSKVWLNPNIISSKLVCSSLHPIIRKIDKDGLLVTPLSQITLLQKTSSELEYHFEDKCVDRVQKVITMCYQLLDITLPENIIFVRNRYYKFCGRDSILEKLDTAHRAWLVQMSDFCQKLLKTIIELEERAVLSDETARNMCLEFKKDFKTTENELLSCERRAFVQLFKIGEMIYANKRV